jgi:hypothetical protein
VQLGSAVGAVGDGDWPIAVIVADLLGALHWVGDDGMFAGIG